MIGAGTSTAAWKMSGELGPIANFSALGRGDVDSSRSCRAAFEALFVFFCDWR